VKPTYRRLIGLAIQILSRSSSCTIATVIAITPIVRLIHVSPLGHARSGAGAAGVQLAITETEKLASRSRRETFCAVMQLIITRSIDGYGLDE
jgi:hypothetical protein